GCRLDAARARHQGQRFTQEPCGTRQFHRARCGSSAATRRAIRRAAPPLPADQCSGRMLRHRPTSCGLHLGVVPRRIAWSCRRVGKSAASADKWGAAGAHLLSENRYLHSVMVSIAVLASPSVGYSPSILYFDISLGFDCIVTHFLDDISSMTETASAKAGVVKPTINAAMRYFFISVLLLGGVGRSSGR